MEKTFFRVYLSSKSKRGTNEIKIYCGVEQLVARRAHNPKVARSSRVPATRKSQSIDWLFAFPEAMKVYFQKRIGMQKERAQSGLALPC